MGAFEWKSSSDIEVYVYISLILITCLAIFGGLPSLIVRGECP